MANREVIDTLKQYILLLNKEGISVKQAFLFGSYANDTAREFSDIDVLIVSDNVDERNDQAIGKAWSLTRKINTLIEPHLIGLERFTTDDDSPWIYMIKKHGLRIL
jgi:uncharacterized protein